MPLHGTIAEGVKAAESQGFDTLYVADYDANRATQCAGEGLAVRGVKHVRDLFGDEVGGFWAAGP